MPNFTLAQYRFVALDKGIQFELFQPASVALWRTKMVQYAFDYSSTVEFYRVGMWSMLPETHVFQDSTTISL